MFRVSSPLLASPYCAVPISSLGSHFAQSRAALAPKTFSDVHGRVLTLYRQMIRAVPDACRIHKVRGLFKVENAERALKSQFLENRDVKDPNLIYYLVERGEMEYEETIFLFKTPYAGQWALNHRPDQVKKAKEGSFMANFLKGRV